MVNGGIPLNATLLADQGQRVGRQLPENRSEGLFEGLKIKTIPWRIGTTRGKQPPNLDFIFLVPYKYVTFIIILTLSRN